MSINFDQFSVEELICDQSFQQYCLGSNIASVILWEDWLKTNPSNLIDFIEAKRVFYILSAKQGNKLEQLQQLRTGISQFENFKDNFSLVPEKNIIVLKPKKAIHILNYIGLAAASVLLIALASVFFKIPNVLYSPKPTVQYSSGNLSRKTIILNDGSIITLRKNSELKVASNFNTHLREVWLTGEAFFNVKHNKAKPFIVHAAQNNIVVLGTGFNVKAYPGAVYTETSLIEGSVSITNNQDKDFKVILTPNHKFISASTPTSASASTSSLPKPIIENMVGNNKPGDETKWIRNKMELEDQSLFEIAKRLEIWYGIKIEIKDKQVGKYQYSGVFDNESLIKTLEVLQLSYHFNFKTETDKITISK